MIVTEVLPLKYSKKKNRYRVRFEDGTDFILYKKELNRYGIEQDFDVEESVINEIINEILVPRAKKRALHLLEKMDRTESNLRKKLTEGGYPIQAVDIAIEYVSDYNYINDVRYTANYIRYKRNSRGEKRIKNDLYEKGINKEIIEEAIYILEDELEEDIFKDELLVYEYVEKKLSNTDEIDDKYRTKVYNHLLRAGFSPNLITNAIRKFDSCTTWFFN